MTARHRVRENTTHQTINTGRSGWSVSILTDQPTKEKTMTKPDAIVKIQPIVLTDQSEVFDIHIPSVVLNAITLRDAETFVVALHDLVKNHTNNSVDYVRNAPRQQ